MRHKRSNLSGANIIYHPSFCCDCKAKINFIFIAFLHSPALLFLLTLHLQQTFTLISFSFAMNDVTFSGPSSAADSKGRIDFISELPFDIVTDNIIPRILDYDHQPLNLHEEWIYFSVCSSWSQRIASSGMAIRIEGHWLLTKEDWMCIKALAPYIQRLLLPMGAPDSICNLLEYARLSSLITLTITSMRNGTYIHLNTTTNSPLS